MHPDDDTQRLQTADDPVNSEFPPEIDDLAEKAKLERLRDTLNERYRCTCRIDLMQDSACHGALIFAREMLAEQGVCRPYHPATNRALGPQMRASNFGSLAIVIHEDVLRAEIRDEVRKSIEAAGYVLVSPDAVVRAYTGDLIQGETLVRDTGVSWFWRFFDYQ